MGAGRIEGARGDPVTPEFLLQLIVALGAPVAVYGAIKADLARALAKAEAAEVAATRAHARIDDFHNAKGARQ